MRKFNKAASAFLAAVMTATSAASLAPAVFAQTVDTTDTRENVTVIDVTDFGADPTGIEDSQPAVIKAIEAAKNVEGPVTINFPEGTYQMYPDKAFKKEMYLSNTTGIDAGEKIRTVGICLEEMNDVIVEGNGSRFMFHHKMTPYATINCQNVTLQNFSIDFATPTCYEMVATERDEANKTIIFHIPEANNYRVSGNDIIWSSDKSPYTGETYWTQSRGFGYTQSYNAATGESWRGSTSPYSGVSSIEDLGDHKVKFHYSSMPNIQPGIVWQTRDTTRDQVAGGLLYSKGVTLKNIEENYVHGFGMIVQMSEDITLDGVIFDTPEKSGRATSSSADDINISGVKGKIEIKNSRFHNPHDDPINVHGTFLLVTGIDRENKKVTLDYQHNQSTGFPNYFIGDKIEFSTKGSLVPIDPDTEYTVVDVDGPDGFGGWMGEGNGNKNQITITLDKELPEGISVRNSLVENITYTPDVHIHHNEFVGVPTRGILCTTRGEVVIEDNLFYRMGMAGIYISCDGQSWYESGRSTDVTIRNNTFIRNDVQDIYIDPTNPNVAAGNPVHRNIKIEGNTFIKDAGSRVLDAKSTEGILFKNNTILRADPIRSLNVSKDTLSLEAGSSEAIAVNADMTKMGGNLYNFNGSSDIHIEGNTYDPGFTPSISFGGGTNASHVTIVDDKAAPSASQIAEDAKAAFVSSNPEVASVDIAGNVTGRKPGKATITSYIISGGRKFEAGTTEVTVTDPSEQSVSISISGEETLNAGESAKFTANVEGSENAVTWSVIDASTGMEAAIAGIDENGILMANGGGVVLVKAQCDGASAIKAVQIKESGYALADGVKETFRAQADPDGTGIELGNDRMTIPHLRYGIYQGQQNTEKPYLFNIDMPEGIDRNDVTVTVKVDTQGATDWGYSGLYLMKDPDNYVATELKNRGGTTQKFAGVKEANATAAEYFEGGTQSLNEGQFGNIFWYRLKKSGNTVEASYSKNGTDFTVLTSDMDGSMLGDAFTMGLCTGTSSNSGRKTTYSDLTVKSGDVEKHVALTREAVLDAPKSASIEMEGGAIKVTCEKGSETSSLITVWEAADNENGPWTTTDRVSQGTNIPAKALKGKFVRAKVFEKQGSVVSDPTISNAIQIKDETALTIDIAPASVKAGETAAFKASVSGDEGAGITWSVKDAITHGQTAAASIDENGVLTGKANGLVLVEAAFGALKASVPVRVEADTYTISDNGVISHAGDKNAMSFGDGSFASKPVGNGIFNTQTGAGINMVQYALPADAGEDYEITAKLNGFVPAGTYRESGVYLMDDFDHYISVQRKTRPGGVKMAGIREIGPNPDEYFEGGSEGAGPNVTQPNVWVKIVKNGNDYKTSYSTDNETWRDLKTFNAELSAPKIGLAASGGNAGEATTTFSELKVNGKAIDMTKRVSVTEPENISAAINDKKNGMILSSEVKEGAEAVVVWEVSDSENGNWSVHEGMSESTPAIDESLAGKYVRAVVYAKENGAFSNPVVSNAVYIDEVGEADNPAVTVVSSEARLKTAMLDGEALNPDAMHWFIVKDKDTKSVSVDFEALDSESTVTVTRNTKPIDAHAKEVALEPGYNLIEVRVGAKDGKTMNVYRLQIFRYGDGNDDLASFKVNNTDVTIDETDNTADVLLGSDVNMAVIEAIAASENSSVMVLNDKGEEVTSATPIVPGKNTFKVVVQTETLKAPRIINLTLRVAEESSTLLENAAFTNAELAGKFDSFDKEFNGTVFNQSFGYSFKALDETSTIEVFFNGKSAASKTGTGSVEGKLSFDQTKEINTVAVKVTSADKSRSKTYTFNMEKQATMYVSDMVWEKATSGDAPANPVRADKATSNNPILVNDENGAPKEYAKGIGLHADGEVVIDLTQTAFPAERFEAIVGIDGNTHSGQPENYPKLVFTVYGINADGVETKLAESGVMLTATPGEKLSCELGDSVKLRLVVKTTIGNVWNAHADWADAKLTTTFESAEEPGETVNTLLDLVTTTAEDIIRIKDKFKEEGMAALEEAAAASRALLEKGDATQEEMNRQAEITNDALLKVRREPTEDALNEILEYLK